MLPLRIAEVVFYRCRSGSGVRNDDGRHHRRDVVRMQRHGDGFDCHRARLDWTARHLRREQAQPARRTVCHNPEVNLFLLGGD